MEFFIKKDYSKHRFDKHWQFGVGSDHAVQMLRKDYCEQLKRVHDELGIRYVRFHGIFCDDMKTIQTFEDVLGISGTDHFQQVSFRRCGQVYDNVLSCGMKPFVELSFMPTPLARVRANPQVLYAANTNPPVNYERWGRFIESFIRYLLNRYGQEEVETWYFEVWNEPDLQHPFFKGTQEDYFALYDVTARTIKNVCPALRVGGPATSGSHWISDFVRHCRKSDIPVDFISSHQYVGDPFIGVSSDNQDKPSELLTPEEQAESQKEFFASVDEGMPLLSILRRLFGDPSEKDGLDRDVFSKNADLAREQADGLPLIYDEWNMVAMFSAYSNDTRKQSAYVVRTALNMEGKTDGTAVWCFSDIFEELHQFPEEFHGGFGLLTQGGIPKPTFFAMKMLAEAGDDRVDLPVTEGVVEAAAFESDTEKQVLLYRQNLKQENLPKEPVTIKVELEREPQRVVLQRIDETHCNPLKLWEDMGSPEELTPNELAALKKQAELLDETVNYRYEHGVLTCEARLGVNDVYFFRITK
ncbi:MAG: hypothetical protein J1D89_08075 [Agathobacter sp.]|nr:hypothetical protein [Agathobacter sp.]